MKGGLMKTVLIVEDNELNMKLFNDLLESRGYAVIQTRNGMEAMADTAPGHRLLGLAAYYQDGEIIVRISDQGSGLSEEVKPKLFTAFFTTKPEGMGIGLSICRSIIEFHRGRLWAESNPDSPTGTGTLFLFTLPVENSA